MEDAEGGDRRSVGTGMSGQRVCNAVDHDVRQRTLGFPRKPVLGVAP